MMAESCNGSQETQLDLCSLMKPGRTVSDGRSGRLALVHPVPHGQSAVIWQRHQGSPSGTNSPERVAGKIQGLGQDVLEPIPGHVNEALHTHWLHGIQVHRHNCQGFQGDSSVGAIGVLRRGRKGGALHHPNLPGMTTFGLGLNRLCRGLRRRQSGRHRWFGWRWLNGSHHSPGSQGQPSSAAAPRQLPGVSNGTACLTQSFIVVREHECQI